MELSEAERFKLIVFLVPFNVLYFIGHYAFTKLQINAHYFQGAFSLRIWLWRLEETWEGISPPQSMSFKAGSWRQCCSVWSCRSLRNWGHFWCSTVLMGKKIVFMSGQNLPIPFYIYCLISSALTSLILSHRTWAGQVWRQYPASEKAWWWLGRSMAKK